MKTKFFVLIFNIIFSFSVCFSQQAIKTNWNKMLSQPAEWYKTNEARRIAGNVLLYQNVNGGWEKNLNMDRNLFENEIVTLTKERLEDRETTIDNGATYSQIRFLALVNAASPDAEIKKGIEKGIDYLLGSQYDNGGWPQFYPLRKGYYTHITFNDNAMVSVMQLLKEIASGQAPFGFIDQNRKDKCAIAIEKGMAVILKSQVIVGGVKTVWCAQHDEKDLSPAKARAYELPSLSGSESVGIVTYLMAIENPDQRVKEAIVSAVKWFDKSKITGKKVEVKKDASLPKGFDYVVVDDEKAGPLWARFYEIETNQPIFVGRDGKIKYNLSEIEYERRTGYNYLGNWAQKLLEKDYPAWAKKWNVN